MITNYKYISVILILLSISLGQSLDPLALQDLAECPEVFDNPYYNDFAHFPDFSNSPPPWVPKELIVQLFINGEWVNQTRLGFYGPQHDAFGIVQWRWCTDGLDWIPQSVMDMYWYDGYISHWTVTDVPTGLTTNACYFSGPYYGGIPSVESYWVHNGTAFVPHMDVKREFDAIDTPISTTYSLPENNAMIDRYRTDTANSSVYPSCPGETTYAEMIDNQAMAIYTKYREYSSGCGDNTGTFDPTDDNDCVPTSTETRDSDGNVVSKEDRTHDIGDCLVDILRLYFPSDNEYYQSTNQWMQWLGKNSTVYDASDYRLVKIDTEYSEDGTNWSDYSRVWISYDGIQMDTNTDESVPTQFELKQNYPNPFNPTTVIEYILLKETNVSIKIYNSLGSEIRTLVKKTQPSGDYQISWDGTDNSGMVVSAGTYFIQLNAGRCIETNKMVLMK